MDKKINLHEEYAKMFQGKWYDGIGEWFAVAGAFLGILTLILLILALPLSIAFLIIRYALTL